MALKNTPKGDGQPTMGLVQGGGRDLPLLGLAPKGLRIMGLAAWAIMQRNPRIRAMDASIADIFARSLDRRQRLHEHVADSGGEEREI